MLHSSKAPLRASIMAIGVLFALTGAPAAAENLPDIRFSKILLADSGAVPAGTARTVPLNSAILEYGLLLESAAQADRTARLTNAPWVSVAMALPLREARLGADDPRALAGATTYCTTEIKPPEAVRTQRKAAGESQRFSDAVRACFVDTDGDLRFDKAFFTGANWPEDQLPGDIEPIAYDRKDMIPLPGARWRVVVKNEDRTRSLGALGFLSQRRVLQTQANIPGPGFSEVRTRFLQPQCEMEAIGIDTSIKTSGLPKQYDLGCTRVKITGYDKGAGTITYVIERHMEPAQVSLSVSFLDINGGTIYTLN